MFENPTFYLILICFYQRPLLSGLFAYFYFCFYIIIFVNLRDWLCKIYLLYYSRRESNPVRLKFKSFGTSRRFSPWYTPVCLRRRNTLLHQNLYNFRCLQFCKAKIFAITRKKTKEYCRISRFLTKLVRKFVFQNRAVFNSRRLYYRNKIIISQEKFKSTNFDK